MTQLDKGSTVFAVDDDCGARDIVVTLVRRMGIQSKGFETGEDFLSGGHHHQPGCVVSDLRMKGMSGLALLAKMRQSGSQMPFILVTAYADVALAVDALERGAITVIEKPIRAQILWDHIVRSLQRDYDRRLFAARRTTLLSRINMLSDDARRILEMIVSDIPNKTISSRMEISLRTVDHRRSEILQTLQMDNVKSLIWHLGEIGWPSPSPLSPYATGARTQPCGRADLDVARS